MNDLQKQQRFVQFRAEGRSFARIGEELGVSKPTLIQWSRKFQFEIQNHRAILLESLQEKWLSNRDDRINALGEQLHKVQAELARRDIATLTTHQLFQLARSLSRQLQEETGPQTFSMPVNEIPEDEISFQAQDWKP